MNRPAGIVAADRAAWCDVAVLVLLAMLLAFMPFAFGAVHAWSELVVASIAAAIAVCMVARELLSAGSIRWTWAYVPVGVFLLVAWVQVVPLPAALLKIISPNTLALKTSLLNDLPNGLGGAGNMTLSFYPNATMHDLRLAVVVATVFVAVVSVFRKPDQVKRLLGVTAAIGGAAGLLALAQDIFGNGMIYWAVPTPGGVAHGGPFVNPGHYAQFMNLTMGAALGLIIVKVHEAFEGRKLTLASAVEMLASREMRSAWALGGVVVVGLATVFLSLSRAGMVSTLMAGGLMTAALAARRRLERRNWVLVLVAVCAFVCVLYVGFSSARVRVAALGDATCGRSQLQVLRDLATPIAMFPSLGAGLGTHAVVYPMFDRGTSAVLAQYAENEYLELLEETGVVGLELVMIFLCLVWVQGWRSMRHLGSPVQSAAFGLCFGLAAAMVQSAADFGQHLPVNACLAAVACGLIVGVSRDGVKREAAAWKRRWGGAYGLALAVGVAAAAVWAAGTAWSAAAAEGEWAAARTIEAQLRAADWRGSDADYEGLLRHAAAALAAQPQNVSYAYWFNVYRWQSISRTRDADTNDVVVGREARGMVDEIVAGLHAARRDCPTWGPIYSLAGQLERFVLNSPAGGAHIRTGYRLFPCHPATCYAAGMLDVKEGRPDDSLAKFRRCAALDEKMLPRIIDVYIRQAKRPDLAAEIARRGISGPSRRNDER